MPEEWGAQLICKQLLVQVAFGSSSLWEERMEDHRVCVRVGTTLAAALAASVLSGLAYAADAPDISGIYWATQYNAKIQIVGGGELPLTAKGKAAYEKNIAGLKDGSIV